MDVLGLVVLCHIEVSRFRQASRVIGQSRFCVAGKSTLSHPNHSKSILRTVSDRDCLQRRRQADGEEEGPRLQPVSLVVPRAWSFDGPFIHMGSTTRSRLPISLWVHQYSDSSSSYESGLF